MANHKSDRNGIDQLMQQVNKTGLDSFDDWPEPPVSSSASNQQRCTSTATISMMSTPRNRGRQSAPPPLSVQYDVSRVVAILPSNLSPVGLNIASGLGTALSALSINGSPRSQMRSSTTQVAPANVSRFRSEVSNFSPVPSNGVSASTTVAATVTVDNSTPAPVDPTEQDTVEDSFETTGPEPTTPRMLKDVKATIADRRSSFFNEVAKSPVLPPRSASQYCVPHSQPLNLVHERTKRFEQRSDASGNTPSLYGYEPVSGEAPAHKRRAGLGTYRAVSNDDAGPATERARSRVDDLTTDVIAESPVFIQSSPLPQFARMEPSPERVLGSYLSDPSNVATRECPDSGTSWESDQSVVPMRAVVSSGDLEERSSSTKLQGIEGNTNLSGINYNSFFSNKVMIYIMVLLKLFVFYIAKLCVFFGSGP